jgi:hypothetical protein
MISLTLHFFILVSVLLVIAAFVLIACFVVVKALRRPSADGHGNRMQRDVEARLAELDSLRSQGRVSADEYARQRRRIIESI